MSEHNQRIRLIAGMEPNREGELPLVYAIGNKFGPLLRIITRINLREENLGSYGIAWFDVFAGDVLLASMNALATSEIYYDDADETP